ncbi:hypothetical protein SAMN02745150_00863 [Brevinema andersonii]|uniref:Uncharacterized protein n=1 Tax=Brevinema andersonii TaxID=34097 RepID=A0A1I1E0L6_BREAD|nr:hypothetical protein [Brevinema andersonii]SFB80196.1 hypothetical protein SAMN02745150_00863 [Brevinema andersonii]
MKFFDFLFSTAVMGVFGVCFGFLYVRIFDNKLFGGVKAGIMVGMLGCILGGFIFNILFETPLLQWMNKIPVFSHLLVNILDINFIAAALGTWMFLFVYKSISQHT